MTNEQQLRAEIARLRAVIDSMKQTAEWAGADGDDEMRQEACETISNDALAALSAAPMPPTADLRPDPNAVPVPIPPTAQPAEPAYGGTDFGYTFAGVHLSDGAKRLMTLLVTALGTGHPAIDDMTALIFSATTQPQQSTTVQPAQCRNCLGFGWEPSVYKGTIACSHCTPKAAQPAMPKGVV